MAKTKLFTILSTILLSLAPITSHALTLPLLSMPTSGNELADLAGLNAQAYIVTDVQTGKVLINKNSDQQWTPASLTKLVTALVVLDTNPNLKKSMAMTSADQIAGACSSGGACIKSKPGIKFTVDGLLHAALMPSANNAANALARSTGLSANEFVARMNQKVADLGAVNTHFNEPTGMDPQNKITAADYSHIVAAAFSYSYLSDIAGLQNYLLRSSNNSKYNQSIKNTDQLLADSGVQILGAKTGYLTESGYNFSALVKNSQGQEYAIVVLGEQHLYTAFDETKMLADLGQETQQLALQNQSGAVLGASTDVPATQPQYYFYNN